MMNMICDTCGTAGSVDDGIEVGGDCQFDDCNGEIMWHTSTIAAYVELTVTVGDDDYAFEMFRQYISDPQFPMLSDYGPTAPEQGDERAVVYDVYDGPYILDVKVTRKDQPA